MSSPRHGDRSGNPDLAQFFTPALIARFVWDMALAFARQSGPVGRVIDPAAGAGVFLQLAVAEGLATVGIEVDTSLAEYAARASGALVLGGDALLERFPEAPDASFDLVVGNPPFGRLGTFAGIDLAHPTWETFGLLAPVAKGGTGCRRRQGMAIDHLFVERALSLVRPGGIIALVMPEGFVANARHQRVRDWVADRAALLATVGLPAGAFTWTGLNARAVAVFLRRLDAVVRPRRPAVLICPPVSTSVPLPAYLVAARAANLELPLDAASALLVRVPANRLAGNRWDAGFWCGRQLMACWAPSVPHRPLGDYIEHLTYGPIVTGARPVAQAGGTRVILQSDFGEAGLDLEPRLRVVPGGPHDPGRSRVRPRDLLMPRSGAGALGRNRVAVYLSDEPANVGCFVDLVRLGGINPFLVWLFLRSEPGWGQLQHAFNGVGMPNISFAEIRALRVPVLAPEEQEVYERRYLAEVLPWHRQGAREAAVQAFGSLVADLEQRLIAR